MRELIVGLFWLDLEEERRQPEIAKGLDISRSYVLIIEKRALMKLFHEFYKQSQGKGELDRKPAAEERLLSIYYEILEKLYKSLFP
ncbi:hypothetical protein AJ85_10905 [Alkalihalobacillus alcalophilus ATCC 27647 = CGMCC 1.3604]|uniref:RNA polymerase sigma-70 region 4 domain-containing protein n=1 Tax=Alkalihalobacillus alcalophilus ATCC 27647 = CGMCC 1.3604 TaxID=1218173 RepID=A0A4S4JYP9_ALKAL|nr:hypothetical protein AJ85_10905 [Alkalihalobacillus alcalophilus ATCC 27647 = CGMCC 1.3604]